MLLLCLLFIPVNSWSDCYLDARGVARLIRLNERYPIQARIELYSAAFLGVPYQLGALGEGVMGEYDKNPLYRFDRFDCETYVDTVIALSLAKDFSEFQERINQIRYKQARIDFFQRNHFPSLDWIPDNRKKGVIQELNHFIAGRKTKVATAFINRSNWYQHLTIDRIHSPYLTPLEKKIYLEKLKEHGKSFSHNEQATITYIPVADILNDPLLRSRIPSGSLVFLVSHANHLRDRIGTPMNVFHMGFAIWDNGELYLRMASSRAGRVLDVRLQDYLKAYSALNILQGMSVWAVQEIP